MFVIPLTLTDAQWAVVESLLPPESGFGQPPKYERRQVVNAILYVVKNGCVWRDLPTDFPKWTAVYYHFARWSADGTTDRVHEALRDMVRAKDGRDPWPSAAIIDAQSVKAADTVGKGSRGFDAGKE